jgi:hypothetical protein
MSGLVSGNTRNVRCLRPETSNSMCITTYQSAHTALKDTPEDEPIRSETL